MGLPGFLWLLDEVKLESGIVPTHGRLCICKENSEPYGGSRSVVGLWPPLMGHLCTPHDLLSPLLSWECPTCPVPCSAVTTLSSAIAPLPGPSSTSLHPSYGVWQPSEESSPSGSLQDPGQDLRRSKPSAVVLRSSVTPDLLLCRSTDGSA